MRNLSWRTNKFKYFSTNAFGGHWATTQTIWEDKCSYHEFRYVIEFVRNAIKVGGTYAMKSATHKVTMDMPDYLSYS